jgi:hypothetical protein
MLLVNLPKKVILNITCCLRFRDKLNSATTCKALYDLISATNLYDNLKITGSKEKVENVIEQFKSNKYNNSQVKTLEIDFGLLSSELHHQLPDIFPKVTTLVQLSKRFLWISLHARLFTTN